MYLQNLDFLSPSISLYFNDQRTHISKISGIIVIIMVSCCLSYSIIILYNIFNHLNVTSLIYKKFEYEAGYYEMNAKVLFHFFQIFSSENGRYFDKYNSKYIRIYTTYVHNNIDQSQLYKYDHWVFDQCKEGIDNKDINKELFKNIVNFTNSACIKYYYNSQTKNYYSLEDNEFMWPHLEHGNSRRDNVFLTTLFEKCSNNSVITTILGNCDSNESIEKYINKYFAFYMYLLDNSVDPTNYTSPFQNYFQIISSGIGNSQTFVENYIHFAPVRLRTKVGHIFGKYEDINSFFFDFNRKGTANSYNKILLKNYYLMQNNCNIYERRYNDFFDILSNIGGTCQLLFFIFFTINYIYNKYIIVMDTNHFFCKIQTTSHDDNNTIDKNKILDPFKDFAIGKNSLMKTIKKSIYSLNLNSKNPLNKKTNDEIKSENERKTKIENNKNNKYSKFGSVQLKINNFLIDSKKTFNQNDNINYLKSSYISNDSSLDYSNANMKQISSIINKEKKVDSLNLIRDKNIISNKNLKHDYIPELYNMPDKNISEITLPTKKQNNKINNTNKEGNKPKKSFHFRETLKDGNIFHNKKRNRFQLTLRPTFKMSNLEEMLKTQKLNKEMVHKSTNFEKEFSFFYFILCEFFNNKRKQDFKNLYSLISFRKKILSENFIFHQYIINLLLGKKCGIDPHEIKNLI